MSSAAQRARQREQRENVRREILAAADRFLRERPYRELSVETVMAQTGLSRTAFYRHFDDVTDLVLRLLENLGRELYDVAGRWHGRAGHDYPIAAREGLAAIVDFFVAHGPLVRAIAEAAAADVRIERGYHGSLEAFIELTKQALDGLVERGALELPDTRATARALNLMNEAYLLREFGYEPPGDRDIALATLETIWLRVAGPRPDSQRGILSPVEEVIPGILHWQARHPNIGADVSSYLLTDSGTALDPILPEGEGPEWLGYEVKRVILTVRHHIRSAPNFGVPILAHESGLHEFEGQDLDVTGYGAGDELAPGIRALPFGRICPDDAVLHIALGPGVLAFGDGLIHYGELGHPPDQYLGEDPEAIKADIVDGLVPLLDEEFDALLFAHGLPVASGGKAMLREFVQSRR